MTSATPISYLPPRPDARRSERRRNQGAPSVPGGFEEVQWARHPAGDRRTHRRTDVPGPGRPIRCGDGAARPAAPTPRS